MRGASALASRRRRPELERAGLATVGLVLVASLLAGVAYLHIYSQPVTRVEASRWLLRNLQPGTTVATEHWDEGLPLQLPTEPPKQLRFAELPWYEVDSPQKMTAIIQTLDKSRLRRDQQQPSAELDPTQCPQLPGVASLLRNAG